MKIEEEKEGFPASTIREIGVLKELNHLNVVRLLNVIFYKMKILMVFEFCTEDLHNSIHARTSPFSVLQVRQMVYQLLKGVDYLHKNNFFHRDLKPQNVLLTAVDESLFSPKGGQILRFLICKIDICMFSSKIDLIGSGNFEVF